MNNNRVTPQSIEAAIASTEFVVHGKVTIAFLTLINGFVVTGESAPVDPANFDKEMGEKYARENAIEKLWMPMGFLLQERLHQRTQALAALPADPMFDGFTAYESKPIYRMAMEIEDGARVTYIEPNTYSYMGIRFKAYETPQTGDYICRLKMEDTYHVSRAVFHERNHVE